MRKAITENRMLITLAVILLIAALIITLFPQLQAEAQGGYCTAKYVKVWDASIRRYITVKRWTCTGYIRPYRFRRYW